MKTIRIILFVGLCFQFQQAAAQTTYNMAGNWTVDADKTFDSMSVQQKVKYDNMPLQKRQEIKQSFQNRTFHFLDNTQAEISFTVQGNSKLIKGNWTYESDNKRLIINSEGKSSEYIIKWLDNNQVQLLFATVAPQGLLQSLFLLRNN
ncbi:MAG: hypothetical protein E6H07_13195 [Bacteroidetes bacterium]|nr:MAG: hypothetical protein E6H07_13195 [Bacteroidota bacterium]